MGIQSTRTQVKRRRRNIVEKFSVPKRRKKEKDEEFRVVDGHRGLGGCDDDGRATRRGLVTGGS